MKNWQKARKSAGFRGFISGDNSEKTAAETAEKQRDNSAVSAGTAMEAGMAVMSERRGQVL
jgi:hypothetical protein